MSLVHPEDPVIKVGDQGRVVPYPFTCKEPCANDEMANLSNSCRAKRRRPHHSRRILGPFSESAHSISAMHSEMAVIMLESHRNTLGCDLRDQEDANPVPTHSTRIAANNQSRTHRHRPSAGIPSIDAQATTSKNNLTVTGWKKNHRPSSDSRYAGSGRRRSISSLVVSSRAQMAILSLLLLVISTNVMSVQASVWRPTGGIISFRESLKQRPCFKSSFWRRSAYWSIRGGASGVNATTVPLVTDRGGDQAVAKPSTSPLDRLNDKTDDSSSAVSGPSSQTPPSEEEASAETNKEDPRVLFLIRVLFLTYYGSLGALLPYLPVYYHSLGHGGQIIGLLGAVKPFTTFLVAPLWGLIADETQRPFTILKVTFIMSVTLQLLVGARHDAFYLSIMVFLTALFNAPVKSLIDTMVMENIHDQSSYGKLRLWGQMGFGLGSSSVGMILSKSRHVPWPETTSFSEHFEQKLELHSPKILHNMAVFLNKFWQSFTGYKLLFFTHAALSIPTWWCIRKFEALDSEQKTIETSAKSKKKRKEKSKGDGDGESSHAKITKGLFLLVHNADALLFFFLVFVVGISSGVIENFAYVRMREVGGTGKEMGLSRLVSSVAGAPMFWFSGPLTQALGADRVIVLSLMSYVTRFVIYACMVNPLHGLPAEALRGITFAAFWSTGTIYAHRVSPPGLHATMLMFLNAMYGGLGQSLGAIIGGKLQHRYGTVRTFLWAAAFDFIFVSLVILYLSVRKDSSFKDPKPIGADPNDTKEEGNT